MVKHTITVKRRYLSDDSEVFDVWIGGACIPAITQDDAISMAESFQSAINEHSNDEAVLSDD